jgi:hypothetical protein
MKKPQLVIKRVDNGWVVDDCSASVVVDSTMVFENRYGLTNYIDDWVSRTENQARLNKTEQADDDNDDDNTSLCG